MLKRLISIIAVSPFAFGCAGTVTGPQDCAVSEGKGVISTRCVSCHSVNVTGGVTLAGAQLNGSLINGFTAGATDLFFIIINDGADPVQGAFAQGTLVTIGTQLFSISYTGNFTGTPATSTFTGGNDVVLRAVPEPGTAALLLLGALGLGGRRRRA